MIDYKLNILLKIYCNFIEDILGIDACSVFFMEETPHEKFKSYCCPNKRVIYIQILKDASIVDYLYTITHELRHQYQYDCLNISDMAEFEEPSTIKKWKESFDNYHNSTETGIEVYNMQAVELDANAFAYYVMKVLFGIEVFFVRDNFKMHEERYIEIASDLVVEEIRECLKESEFVSFYKKVNDMIRKE